MKISRSNLGLPIGLLTTLLLVTGAAALPNEPPTLKDAYKGRFSVGVAINRSVATGEAPASGDRTAAQVNEDIALVKEQFDQISPENDLKWESIQPREGADGYNFGPADAYVDFGLKNHMLIVGHTLVWQWQTPAWVFAGMVPPDSPPAAAGSPACGRRSPAIGALRPESRRRPPLRRSGDLANRTPLATSCSSECTTISRQLSGATRVKSQSGTW